MTREEEGHYTSKHPPGTSYDSALGAALQKAAEDGRLTCAAAFELVDALRVAPSEVGRTADLLEARIVECQLGLFGYSPEKRIVKPAADVSDELRAHLDRHVVEGRISCAACWKTADTLGIERMAVAEACELLKLRVKPCQLGAF